MIKTKIIAVATLVAAPVLALAQSTQIMSYRCTGNDGKKYYGSTIPMQCVGKPIEQMNSQGRVVRRIDPEGEERERQAKEAAAAQTKEEEAAAREQSRRNRALLATYTNPRDIDDARARALADNQKALRDVENRIEALKKRRAGYDKELEFYQDKKGGARPPAKLAEDMRNTEIDLKAQEDLLAVKRKEVAVINAKYDEEKKRYVELTGKTPAERAKALDAEKGVTVTSPGASRTDAGQQRHEAQMRAANDRAELRRIESEREHDRRVSRQRAENDRRVKQRDQ